jgi:DNA transposition AAA+ family ATPase
MNYTHTQKESIKELCKQQIKNGISQNKFAHKIGISPATLTNLLKGSWELISNDMWTKVADAVGYKIEQWNVVRTANHITITALMREAKIYGETYAFLAPQGSSKTMSVKQFAIENANVAVVSCEEHWTKREFLMKLYRALGHNNENNSIGEYMDAIENVCRDTDQPLIVLDEIDKLSDNLLLFFVSLYNRLHGKCGIFICCTEYLKHRVEKGIRKNRKGFAEFFSRTGGKFIIGSAPGVADIVAICKANGIESQTEIDKILADCQQDLRRVERLIKATNRKKAATQQVKTDTNEPAQTA